MTRDQGTAGDSYALRLSDELRRNRELNDEVKGLLEACRLMKVKMDVAVDSEREMQKQYTKMAHENEHLRQKLAART